MTGDRLPAFFLKGVWQGLKIALIPHARLRDPLGPMPTVRDWLDMYGGTRMDADMFDRCESEWYALLEQRKTSDERVPRGRIRGHVDVCDWGARTVGVGQLVDLAADSLRF